MNRYLKVPRIFFFTENKNELKQKANHNTKTNGLCCRRLKHNRYLQTRFSMSFKVFWAHMLRFRTFLSYVYLLKAIIALATCNERNHRGENWMTLQQSEEVTEIEDPLSRNYFFWRACHGYIPLGMDRDADGALLLLLQMFQKLLNEIKA